MKEVYIFLFSVILSSVSQIMLKSSAGKTHINKIQEYVNPLVVSAYVLFFCSTILTMFAYRKVPLSMGPILEASGYVYITILSWLVLKEKITKNLIIGNILIILGIIIYSME